MLNHLLLKDFLYLGITSITYRLDKLLDYFMNKDGREEETRLDTEADQEESIETLHDIDSSINRLKLGNKGPKGFWESLKSFLKGLFSTAGILLIAGIAGFISGAISAAYTALIKEPIMRVVNSPKFKEFIAEKKLKVTDKFKAVSERIKNIKMPTVAETKVKAINKYKAAVEAFKTSNTFKSIESFLETVKTKFNIAAETVKGSKAFKSIESFLETVKTKFNTAAEAVKKFRIPTMPQVKTFFSSLSPKVLLKGIDTAILNRFKIIEEAIKASKMPRTIKALGLNKVREARAAYGTLKGVEDTLKVPTETKKGLTAWKWLKTLKPLTWMSTQWQTFKLAMETYAHSFKYSRKLFLPFFRGAATWIGRGLEFMSKKFWPIAATFAVWDGYWGFKEGWAKNGLAGAIRGATIAILDGFAGGIWDMLMWIPKNALRLGGMAGADWMGSVAKAWDKWDAKKIITETYDFMAMSQTERYVKTALLWAKWLGLDKKSQNNIVPDSAKPPSSAAPGSGAAAPGSGAAEPQKFREGNEAVTVFDANAPLVETDSRGNAIEIMSNTNKITTPPGVVNPAKITPPRAQITPVTNATGASIDAISRENSTMNATAPTIIDNGGSGANNSGNTANTTNVSNVTYHNNNIPDRSFIWAAGMHTAYA